MACDVVGGEDVTGHLVADAGEERVERGEKLFGRVAAPARVPEPLVAHGAGGAFDCGGVGDARERGGDHVATLEGGGELCALVRVVAEPVEELGPAPLVRVDAAAPL